MKRKMFSQKKTVEVDTLLVGFPNFLAIDGPFSDITQSENYDAFNTEVMDLLYQIYLFSLIFKVKYD